MVSIDISDKAPLMRRLERMAEFAAGHGFVVRVNEHNGDISILIPYAAYAGKPSGAAWEHAKTWEQLGRVLGY